MAQGDRNGTTLTESQAGERQVVSRTIQENETIEHVVRMENSIFRLEHSRERYLSRELVVCE